MSSPSGLGRSINFRPTFKGEMPPSPTDRASQILGDFAETANSNPMSPARCQGAGEDAVEQEGNTCHPQRKPQTRAPGRLMSDLRLILFFQRAPGKRYSQAEAPEAMPRISQNRKVNSKMSLVTMPFYQRRHKHFDQSYRNIQTRYLMNEYAAKTRSSSRSSSQSSSQQSLSEKSSSQRAASQKLLSQGGTVCRLCAKRVSSEEEESEHENKRRYKNGTLISQAAEPGKYRIESKYGVHTLEIHRANFDDTATYSAVATNVHGQASTNAAVVVKRFRGEEEPIHSMGLPIGLPLPSVVPYTHFDVQFLEKFGVTFRREGETVTLKCTLLVTPDLKRVQPRAEWYRDDADPLVTGAPGAPMDVRCHDANRDYVIVTWKPPNTTSEGAVIGYFIDRCEVGTNNWVQCNDSPVKICKYPVTGLLEGRSYVFRVRAINSAGVSRPSRASEAVAALDPADLTRLQAVRLGEDKEIVIYQDDLEGDVQIPGPPTNVHASEVSRTYVVLSWEPPVPRGKEPLTYFIEKSMVGSGSWQRVNAQTAVRSPRYAVFDLAEGKPYVFRVLSANKHGLSDPSEITPPIQAQDTIVTPSAPGRVLVSRDTKTSVVVEWDRPKHQEDLLGYYVDCCMVGSNVWEPCNHKPISYNRFVVHGLTTGEQYMFRVKAVNAVGTSENSQESDAIKVQAALISHVGSTDPTTGLHTVRRVCDCHVGSSELSTGLHTVEGLTEGASYEFKIAASNLVGIGQPSDPSELFKCEAWTAPEPGPTYDLTFCEVRDTSLVLLWKAPVYAGSSPVSGYFVDYKEEGSEEWTSVSEAPTAHRYLKVCDLHQGQSYVFRVRAANASGVGKPSDPSEPVLLEARPGTKEVSAGVDEQGNIYLSFDCPEMTDASQFTWCKAYEEIADEDKFQVETVGDHSKLYFKSPDQGDLGTYSVSVSDTDGVSSSFVLDQAGTKEVSAGVDEQGNIYLSFDCPEMTDASQFTWCKAYEEIADEDKFQVETVGDHSKLYFKSPDQGDLGTYSVSVSDTDGVSSSFVLDQAELERLMALSNEIKNPTVPLKSELAYEVFEHGQVRFWLQAEQLSPDASFRFVINDREVSDSPTHKIKCDKSTGIIEMVMDQFTVENEGTYTVQIHDGKAKNQSSLVLIGDAFKAVLDEAEFQRKEFLRKQGPHFAEYLRWDVTEECEVLLVCKVANTKKETVFRWLKDDALYETESPPDLERGVCELLIPKLSKKDHGEYKATLKDDRGQDVSTLEIAGKVYEDMILAMSRVCGLSASPLKILCTPDGIRLQCFMKYFTEEMRVNWYHKDAKIASSEHMRAGGSEEMAWLQICEPTEKDKGKYTFEISDGTDNHQRSLDLSGQAFDDALAEFQQLNRVPSIADRGKVIGGLPDVVTIMEGKTLNLTCTVFGNPDPEVVWFKNDKDIELNEHFSVKVEQAKFVSMSIKGVTSEDSGKYSINVKNKYGGEKIDVTVSVYQHGEMIPEVQPPQQATPKLIPASASGPAQ
ncbi:Myomesin-2 [Myotis brandtii]|uniref:Myomesin-2 n=1 Tax=Myotis brandtii TaxID=109478 RepID=S7NH93_MYOBR|nr:Myomesin-2 [Myotis brandtii]